MKGNLGRKGIKSSMRLITHQQSWRRSFVSSTTVSATKPSGDISNLPWLQGKVSWDFWKEKSNQLKYFRWLAEQLNIKNTEDWYNIKVADVYQRGGSSLLNNYFGGSIVKALATVYPEAHWEVWRFEQVPKGYWDELKNQRIFFDSIAKKLNVVKSEEWYKVSREYVRHNGGASLLVNYYNGSLIKALSTVYPEREWKYEKVPRGYWEDLENQKEYFEMLSSKLGIKKLDDWYTLRAEDVFKIGGYALINEKYGGSLVKALLAVFPEYNWQIWKFDKVPKGYWEVKENQKKYFDLLASELQLKDGKDWLEVRTSEVTTEEVSDFSSDMAVLYEKHCKMFTQSIHGSIGDLDNNPAVIGT